MTNKPTLIIGIPAFNEESNIGYLLNDLLSQKESLHELKKIIVSSDASSDKTDEIVKAASAKDSRVVLFSNTQREGQAARQNQIIEATKTDMLVLLNADILIKGDNFIDSLIKPITTGSDLVCGPLLEINPKTSFEKIVALGSRYRRNAFAKYRNGSNVFTCHGSHRAFSKRFYQDFRFIGSVAEDSFSYLSCIKQGYKYSYAKKAEAYIKLPDNLDDHIKQSSRFFSVQDKLTNYFDKDLVAKNLKLPFSIMFIEGLKTFLSNPLLSLGYALVSAYIFLITKLHLNDRSDTWKTVTSSKSLRK